MAAAACCRDTHRFSGASVPPLPTSHLLRYVFVARTGRLECSGRRRRGFSRIWVAKGRWLRSLKFGRDVAIQSELHRVWSSEGFRGAGERETGRPMGARAAVATSGGAEDLDSRWGKDRVDNRNGIWTVWDFKATSGGERLAILGMVALTGLTVVRVLRGSAPVSVGAIIFFLCLAGFHPRLKPIFDVIKKELDCLKGKLVSLIPINFPELATRTRGGNSLFDFSSNSAFTAAASSGLEAGISGSAGSVVVNDVWECVTQLKNIISTLDIEVITRDVQSVGDLKKLQLGITELRGNLYKAASALHAKETLLQTKLEFTTAEPEIRPITERPIGSVTVQDWNRESSDLDGVVGGSNLSNRMESAGSEETLVNPDVSISLEVQRRRQQSHEVFPAGKGSLSFLNYQVITADYEPEPVTQFAPVADRTYEASANSEESEFASPEVASMAELRAGSSSNFQSTIVTNSLAGNMVKESPEQWKGDLSPATGMPQIPQLDAEQSLWSSGGRSKLLSGPFVSGQEPLADDEFCPADEARIPIPVERIAAREQMSMSKLNIKQQEPIDMRVMERASPDPWHDDYRRASSANTGLALDENELSRWEAVVLQLSEKRTALSSSRRWKEEEDRILPESALFINNASKTVLEDGMGKGRGNQTNSVDFWGKNPVNAGRAQRGTLTKIKATRRGTLGSVDNLDNEWPQARRGRWEGEQEREERVVSRDHNGVANSSPSGEEYRQDENEAWDYDSVVDDSRPRGRSWRGSQKSQGGRRDSESGEFPAGDREWLTPRRSQSREDPEETGEYRIGRNPTGSYNSQERRSSSSKLPNTRENRRILADEDVEEDAYGRDPKDLDEEEPSSGSRSGVLDEPGDYQRDRNKGGSYDFKERASSKVTVRTRNNRRMVSDEDGEGREEDWNSNGVKDREQEDYSTGIRSEIPEERDEYQNGSRYGSQRSTNSLSKMPSNSRDLRRPVQREEDEEEEEDEEKDQYSRDTRDIQEDDYSTGDRSWIESQDSRRDVQRGSEGGFETRTEPPHYESELEPEPTRNLPVRQTSRVDEEKFDRLLDEGEALLEEGMQGLEGRIEVGVAERMLYEAASMFQAAAEMNSESLIAIGYWGNTLLVHGELKLKLSQQLRSMLPSSNSSTYSMTRARAVSGRDDERESLEKTLQDVCEECEELLVDAGRKYRNALTLDRSDMRALYNWGLALCYRGQLIADEGGERAIQDADKVYLAAIDKFEAMLGISQEYAVGALYNWGLAMRDRSRLRAMGDRDRVKLLLSAKELFQDAVRLDPNNGQARGGVAAAVAELQELQKFEDLQNEQENNRRSPKNWW